METPPLAPEAEKLIEIQTQLLHQANLKLDRRALQLQAAAEVSRATGSILDPDELIQQVVELTRERFGLYYVGLYLVDQTDGTGKWAVLRAGTGEAGRQMVAQGRRIEVGGDSMVGWCIANRQSRLEEDVTEEAARQKNPLLPATRSKLALPLISRGQAIGAMTIQSAQPDAFAEEDITTLQTMADQLANAIENARLFAEHKRAQEALAEHARQLEETTAFLDSVVENVPLMFFVKDAEDLRWVRWNKAGADTIGLSREELIGKTDYDVFPKEEADFFTRQGPGSADQRQAGGHARGTGSHAAQRRPHPAYAQGADPGRRGQAAIPGGPLRRRHRTQTCRGGGQPHAGLPGLGDREHPALRLRQERQGSELWCSGTGPARRPWATHARR